MQIAEIIIKSLEALAVIITAIYAYSSLRIWRRELVGKRKYEVAEETLRLFYMVKDIISYMRCPLSSQDEGKTRNANPNESDNERHSLDMAYILIERYNNKIEYFNKLRENKYKFVAIFGKDSSKPFDELDKLILELMGVANTLGRKLSMKDPTSKMEDIDKLMNIFWEGTSKEDPIKPKVDQIISDIEKICVPILQGKK